MMNPNLFRYNTNEKVQRSELLNLYEDAGWKVYTARPDALMKAVDNSLFTITVRKGKVLTGFLRAVGDGLTIVYIQDILVLQEYRRQGIGRELLRISLEQFSSVRQIVLLTDNIPETKAFYQNAGFKQVNDLHLRAFVRIRN